MHHLKFQIALLPCLFFLTLNTLFAQKIDARVKEGDTSYVHVIKTKRGDKFIGHVQKIETDSVTFVYEEKTVVYTMAQIETIRILNAQDVEGYETILSYENKGIHRNVLLSSAIPLQKGYLEYKNSLLLFNQLTYAPTSFLSVSFGIAPLFINRNFLGMLDVSIYKSWRPLFHTKLSIKPIVNLSSSGNTSGIIIANPHFTIGNHKVNGTLGYAAIYGLNDNRIDDNVLQALNWGLQFHLKKHWSFKMEVYNGISQQIREEQGAFILPCIGWNNKKNRIEGGLLVSVDPSGNELGRIPYLSYTRTLRGI